MGIYHRSTIAARGSEGVKVENCERKKKKDFFNFYLSDTDFSLVLITTIPLQNFSQFFTTFIPRVSHNFVLGSTNRGNVCCIAH